jgi:16S rRNA (guanine1207-N2)-methyltransferase
MSHYFIDDPEIKSRPVEISYFFAGRNYVFHSDAGVFSAQRIDPATERMLTQMPPLHGSLLDMGCGYGCLGIILAKTYSLELTQADINQRAIRLAQKNSKQNNVKSDIILSDCFDKVAGYFDTIVINPPIRAGKEVVYRMYEGSRLHLKENGRLFVIIQKKHGAESTIAKLRQVFGNCETAYKKKGYYLLSCHAP